MRVYWIAGLLMVGACAQASPPMEMADGSYLISARAAPARGGTAGAYEEAHKQATGYCQQAGKRAVLLNASDRDVYQSAGGGYIGPGGGGFSGGTSAWGSANLRFKCV